MNVLRKLSKNGNLAKFLKELYEEGKIKNLTPEESEEINRNLTAEIEKEKDKYLSLCALNRTKFR